MGCDRGPKVGYVLPLALMSQLPVSASLAGNTTGPGRQLDDAASRKYALGTPCDRGHRGLVLV